MSSFIATQIMEPSKLRSVAAEEADDLEKAESVDTSTVRGTFSSRALRVLRLVGFYSSPVVVELLYSGMLVDTAPDGRMSAKKYITQAYLTNIRNRGMMATYLEDYTEDGIERFMKLAYALATEESEEEQFAITQNIDQWARNSMSRIGEPVTIEMEAMEPSETIIPI